MTVSEIQFKSDIDVELIQSMGGDHMVVAAAKVSTTGTDALLFATDENAECNFGLINYLMKHRHGCYDSETEVLTEDGWKYWPDVTGAELFATLNVQYDEIEYQRAERVVHKRVDGPMIRIKMTHVDALVTPDHNMLAAPRSSGGWVYGLHPAKDFLSRCHRIRLGGGLWGGQLHCPNAASIVGFAAADASVGDSIEFHLTKSRKIEWLSKAHPVVSNGDRHRLKSPSDEVRRWCKETYTDDGDRCFPRELLQRGDLETIRAMLDGYLEGDGHVSSTGKVTCSTVSRRMVGDIQEAAMKCGLSAVEIEEDTERDGSFGSRPLFRLTIYRARNSEPRVGWTEEARSREVSVVEYHGDVHCVTVPNGTLYVRRNGKPMWCGNTPFEHSAITFFVRAPIFVWREWHRHRIGFSYNEESGRYKKLDPVFYIPDRERPMMKVDDWKPGRPKFLRCESQAAYIELCNNLMLAYSIGYDCYLKNLALGVDPGLARDCLPVGIYSGCWVTCNPRSLMSFLSLRTHEPEAKQVSYPLWEIELAARACEKALEAGWPLTYKAFCENGRVGP